MSIPNPLEEAAWLAHGTYVGMPEGFQDAPNVRVNLYGTREGHVEWLSVESGYRDGEIRVTLDAMLYSDLAENKSPDSGWSVELERQSYLANVDDNPVLITDDSGEQYVSRTAYLAHGHVLYQVSVIGIQICKTMFRRRWKMCCLRLKMFDRLDMQSSKSNGNRFL